MKKIAIKDLVKKLSDINAGLIQDIHASFSDLSEAQLNWQPNERTWSIAQSIEHLNAYFRYYIPVFKGKIANSRFREPIEYFSSSPLGVAAYRQVKLGKVKNVKRKLKSPKEYNPIVNAALTTEHSLTEFLEHEKQFIAVIEEAGTINIRKTKCPLSLRPVVKLNLGDALIFITYHCERHIQQAKNVMALKSFPKT